MRPPRLPRTVVRFAVVGVANTLIDLLLFWVLQVPLGILAANFLSTSAGMAFSFVVNGRHTFGATRVTGQQALAFLATNALTLWLLQPLIMVAARDVAAVPLMTAKTLALGGTVVTNFLLYRYVVWPTRRSAASTGSGAEAGGACAGAAAAVGAHAEQRPAADAATSSDAGLWSGARVRPLPRSRDGRGAPSSTSRRAISPSQPPGGRGAAPEGARR